MPRLPRCAHCKELIPEQEIYYTVQGKDYCQHCAQDVIDNLPPDQLDEWLDDPQ